MDFPVRQHMEVYAGIVRDTPPERVQNRTPEAIVDVPVPHIKEDGLLLAPQERVHIKGLDKHNMPRLGDVMVPPPPDHQRALWAMWSKWLLRTSLCTAFKQSARAAAAAPSSNGELLRFQQNGVGPVLGPGY